MSVLQPVLDADSRRGNRARVLVGELITRGEAPRATLAHPLDRASIEAEFELGPLVHWMPGPHGWTLIETVAGITVTSGPPRLLPRRRRMPPTGVASDSAGRASTHDWTSPARGAPTR